MTPLVDLLHRVQRTHPEWAKAVRCGNGKITIRVVGKDCGMDIQASDGVVAQLSDPALYEYLTTLYEMAQEELMSKGGSAPETR